MDPGPLPDELPELSPVEEALISRGTGFMSLYRLPKGGTGYRGHVCHFPQKVHAWVDRLPLEVWNTDIIIVRRPICQSHLKPNSA